MIDSSNKNKNRWGSEAGPDRRAFLSGSSVAVATSLAAGYGALIATGARFLYPAAARANIWMFVSELEAIERGHSLEFEAPTGAKIVIARQGETGTVDDFVALSSTCPHLGCQVDWKPREKHFYCPCHAGVFDPQGKAIGGPPAAAGQSLPRYPLKIENGLLFIEVPIETLVTPGRRPAVGRSGRQTVRGRWLAEKRRGRDSEPERA